MKIPRYHFPEILEDRIAPAGLVTAAYTAGTGELTLTGDGSDNSILVFQTGPSTFRIQGDATDIGAVSNSFLDIGKLTKLTINMGAGADTVRLINLRTLDSLTYSGGPGDDDLDTQNLGVKGRVELNGDADFDSITLDGLSTSIGGDLVTESAGGPNDTSNLFIGAQVINIGGTLRFTGGGAFSELTISPDSDLGFLSVKKGISVTAGSGGLDFSVNDLELGSIGKLPSGESVLYTSGGASNSVDFTVQKLDLAGGIRFLGGALDDRLSIEAATGEVKVGKLPTGESILFDGGASDDTIALTGANLNFTGGIEFKGGDGVNRLISDEKTGLLKIGQLKGGASVLFTGTVDDNLVSLGAARVDLAGGIDFSATGGSNVLTLLSTNGLVSVGKLKSGASIDYKGGTGTDSINLQAAVVNLKGGVSYSGGDGANELTLLSTTGRTTFGKLNNGYSIDLTGGSSDDRVALNAHNLTLAGGIRLAGAGGQNTVDLTSANGDFRIGAGPTGRSVLITGNNSNELLSDLWRVSLAGGVEVTGGDTLNVVEFDDQGRIFIGKFGTGQSIVVTGAGSGTGANTTRIDGFARLAGSLEVSGADASTLDLDGSVIVGKNAAGFSAILLGGAGDDDLDFDDRVVTAGSVKMEAGAGGLDQLDFNNSEIMRIGGNVEYTGGAGTDGLDLSAKLLVIAGSVTFTGGGNDDRFSVLSDGSIGGDVTVNMGTAVAGESVEIGAINRSPNVGIHSALPDSLRIRGKLTVDTAAAAAVTDEISLANLSVGGVIDLKMGEGASTVAIDNLNAGDELKIDTRGGSDVVSIERENYFGGSVVRKLATIQLGLGDDELRIGSPATSALAPFPDPTRVNFLAGLTANGGVGGTDRRNDIVAQNTGVVVSGLTEFEDTTLV